MIALREKRRRRSSIEVDHIVAWTLWESKVNAIPSKALTADESAPDLSPDELLPRVNDLGNCMLLEKNFNISKSAVPLKAFLDGVYEFKEKKLELNAWAASLDLDMAHVDCSSTSVDQLRELISRRSEKIRGDLEHFIRGTRGRVDLDAV
jgi:hypothetical protein